MTSGLRQKEINNCSMNEGTCSWSFYIVAFGILVELMSFFSGIFSKRPFYESFVFTGYQIVAILIPGLAYVELLKVKFCETGTARILLSYAVGYGSNILIYYILFFLGKLQNNRTIGTMIFLMQFIACLWVLCRSKVRYRENARTFFLVPFMILGLFGIELLSYCGSNMLPPHTNASNVVKDILYWIGNSIALKLQYPPFEFRVLREHYGYHFFSSIQIALESIITGVKVAELSICYSYIQAAIILIGGFYCLVCKYIKKIVPFMILTVLFFFTSGFEDITRVYWEIHLYVSQFGFDYGIGFLMFFLLILICFFEESSYANLFLTGLFFALLMGIKSPFACIAILGVACGCSSYLIKRNWKKSIVVGGMVLAIFFMIYYGVCSIENCYGDAAENAINFSVRHWEVCEQLGNIRNIIFQNQQVPSIILEIFFFGIFIFLCNPCLLGSAFAATCFRWIRTKKIEWLDVSCIVMILLGMGLALYIHMQGKSNTYFATAVYPVALLMCCRFVAYLYDSADMHDAIIKKGTVAVGMSAIICGCYLFLFHSEWEPLYGYMSRGYHFFRDDGIVKLNEESGISDSEYQVLQFIDGNVEKGRMLIAFNNREDDRNLAGIFSEHKTKNYKASVEDYKKYLEQSMNMGESVILMPVEMGKELCMKEIKVLFENEEWVLFE